MKQPSSIKEIYPDLPKETLDQLDFICADFGREVEFVIEDDKNFKLSASAENNIPIIKAASGLVVTEGDIIHEVWHLYMKSILKANNYNASDDLINEMISYSGSPEQFQYNFFCLHSAVEHYYFLKKIALEYKPYAFLENSLEEVLKNPTGTFSKGEQQQLAIDTLQVLILSEKPLNCDVALNHLKSICPAAFKLGSELFSIVKGFNEIIQEPVIMERCIRLLWEVTTEIESTNQRQIVFRYKK